MLGGQEIRLTSTLCCLTIPQGAVAPARARGQAHRIQRMHTSSPGPILWRVAAQGHYHWQHLQILVFLPRERKEAGRLIAGAERPQAEPQSTLKSKNPKRLKVVLVMSSPPYTSVFSTPSLFKNIKIWLTEAPPRAQPRSRAWDGRACATSRPPTPALPAARLAGGLFLPPFL